MYLQRNDSLITGAVTDEYGNFTLKNLKTDSFKLNISFLNYKTVTKIIKLESSQNLGVVILEVDESMLNEVVVKEKKSAVVQSFNKTEYRVPHLVRKNSFDAFDILKNVPLLEVNTTDKTVELLGKKGNILIMVNNIRRDAKFLLSISPSDIQKVEIITAPSARYIADNIETIINVITKDEVVGYTGQVSTSHQVFGADGFAFGRSGFSNVNFRYNQRKFSFYGYADNLYRNH